MPHSISGRCNCFNSIIQDCLDEMFKDIKKKAALEGKKIGGNWLDHFTIKLKRIEDAQKAYFDALKDWKQFFNVTERLDRHRVGAISCHYLLKFCPIVDLSSELQNLKISVLAIINEMLAYNIGISRLKNNGNPYRPEPKLMTSFIQSLRLHRNAMHDSSTNKTEPVQFVVAVSRDFYNFEKSYLLETKLPG